MAKKGKPVGKASVQIGADSTKFKRGLRKLQLYFRRRMRSLKRSAMVGGVAAGAAFAAGFVKSLKSGARYEAQVLQFAGKLGGRKNAKEYLQEIEKYSNATPMTFDDLAKADKQLLSVGRNGVDTLRMLGDAVASAGDVNNLGQDLFELAQIMAKLYAMGDAGLNINEQIRQLGERQLLDKDSYVAALNSTNPAEQMRIIERALMRHKGMMAALSSTSIGLASTLQGETQGMFRQLGLGVLNEARDTIQSLIDLVRRIRKENLGDWAQKIAQVATALSNMFLAIFAGGPAREALWKDLQELGGALVSPLVSGLMGVGKWFVGFLENALKGLAADIIDEIPWLGGKEKGDALRAKTSDVESPKHAYSFEAWLERWTTGAAAQHLRDIGWRSKAPEQQDYRGPGASAPPNSTQEAVRELKDAIAPLSSLHAIQAAYSGGTEFVTDDDERQQSEDILEELKGSRRAQERMEQHLQRQVDYQERNG